MKFGLLKSDHKVQESLEQSGCSTTSKMIKALLWGTRQGKLQGFSLVKGLDFGETFALVARLKAIRILLAYATDHEMKLYQMDVKSVFLNDFINTSLC